jgi:hypothetical protein
LVLDVNSPGFVWGRKLWDLPRIDMILMPGKS